MHHRYCNAYAKAHKEYKLLKYKGLLTKPKDSEGKKPVLIRPCANTAQVLPGFNIQPAVKRAPPDAQNFGCFALVSVHLFEHVTDVILFDGFQRY